MSAYLILLGFITVAWAIVGFSIAIFWLKLRWNLVGGVLLIALVFVLPVIVGQLVLNEGEQHYGMRITSACTIFGMLEFASEVFTLLSLGGYLIGGLMGVVCGVWPRKDDQGNRQRNARSWNAWKLIAAPPVAIGLAAALFFLMDLRAKHRLGELRARHQAILDVQEEVAPRLQNDAASLHDMLMLSLMEDQNPDWIFAATRQSESTAASLPPSIGPRNFELLKIFLPNSPHSQGVLDYAQRHEEEFLQLRDNVLNDGLEYRYWDERLARFTAVHALARLKQNDLDSTLQDLKLLRAMTNQSLDERVGDSFAFIKIEKYRYLVFQAILGTTNPVPDSVYDEMLTDIEDWGPSLRRGLKRHMSQQVVQSIDALLDGHPDERLDFETAYERAAERIILQEHIPDAVSRLEVQINQAFHPPFDPIKATPQSVFPSFWSLNEAWILRSNFGLYGRAAVDYQNWHYARYELIKAVRILQRERADKGRFLTQQEFLMEITSTEFTAATAIDYLTLHNPTTGKAEGAIIASSDHRTLDDTLGFYLGPAIFPIIDDRSPSLSIRAIQFNGPWELAQVKNNPLRLVIPTPKASTKNPSPPMR